MKEKNIILAARILSMVFTPFYLPLVGLIALFTFSYLSLMPWPYKLTVLGLVYMFTILLPTLLIHFYRGYHGWTLIELGKKERRVVPYLLSIVSYFVCYYVMHHVGTRHTDSVRPHQRVVEDIHPYRCHRRCGRSAASLLADIRIQSIGLALRGHYPRRNGRHKPHDSATTLAAPGMLRIPLGIGSGVYGDIGIIAPPPAPPT